MFVDIVIDSDTLTILDYSAWNDSYSLSSGATVSADLVENLGIID